MAVEIRHADDGRSARRRSSHGSPGERPVDVIVGKLAWQSRAVDRAEPLMDGPAVVTAVDLVLLKLYAGGAQDLWDVRELLSIPGSERLQEAVDEELAAHPPRMHDLWAEARRLS